MIRFVLIVIFLQLLPFSSAGQPGNDGYYENLQAALCQPDSVRILDIAVATPKLPRKLNTLRHLQDLRIEFPDTTTSFDWNYFATQLKALPALEKLSIRGGKLKTLPNGFGNLSLKKLYISGARLEQIGPELCRMTTLVELWLPDNRIAELPSCMGTLTQLQTLALSGNRLTSLPESIGKITTLQHLYADRNRISTLPESLCSLSSLGDLVLFRNAFSAEEKDRISKCFAAGVVKW